VKTKGKLNSNSSLKSPTEETWVERKAFPPKLKKSLGSNHGKRAMGSKENQKVKTRIKR